MRARNIKPDFFTDERLIKLSFAERLFFIGLWCFADRDGFFEIKHHEMKLKLFPEQKADISKMLQSLEKEKIIKLHKQYGYLPNFNKHQKPHPNEKKSIVNKEIKDTIIKLHEQSCNYTTTPADIMNDVTMNDNRGKRKEGSTFEEFWSIYPKKKSKDAAIKAWKKISFENGMFESIIKSLQLQMITEDWKKDGGQFIPYPATWLNGKLWQDEIDIDNGLDKSPEAVEKRRQAFMAEKRAKEKIKYGNLE